jgi:photosystem II stability/assembly factor-like uncharacterized protein
MKNISPLIKPILVLLFLLLHFCVIAETIPEWKIHQFSDQPSLRSSAIKNDVIWVAGTKGKVYKSLDKGSNWIDVSLKNQTETDIRDIQALDKNTAILMSVGLGQNSRLYKTIDQGLNWKILYQNNDETGFFDSIAFWDEDNGLLLGDPVDGYYVIKKTHDGGETWNRIESKNLPKKLEKEAAFAASGNTLIISKNGKAWFTTGGFSASIMSSKNHGKNWQRQSLPLYDKTQTAGGYGIALNSQHQVFVVGGDYLQRDGNYNNVVVQNNNGKWLNVNSSNRGLRTAMVCSKSICIITGKLSSDISFDNGHTWKPLHTQGFYTLATEANIIVAAGADGLVGVISI